MGYVEPERAPAQKSAVSSAVEHRTAAHEHALAGDARVASLNHSPRTQSLMQLRGALDESPRVQSQLALQRALNDTAPVQKKPNATGLPDQLKAGVEQLSGLAMDDVRVHYNSAKPAAVQAHAYAQGTDIHLGPGQEKHLPHEAWHVVQQKQGRVKPTLQMKGVAINDDDGLEHEADAMGRRAAASEASIGQQPQRLADRHANSGAMIQLVNGKHPLGFVSSAPRFQKGSVYKKDLWAHDLSRQNAGVAAPIPQAGRRAERAERCTISATRVTAGSGAGSDVKGSAARQAGVRGSYAHPPPFLKPAVAAKPKPRPAPGKGHSIRERGKAAAVQAHTKAGAHRRPGHQRSAVPRDSSAGSHAADVHPDQYAHEPSWK